MEDEFWHGRWRRGDIAFHEVEGNALLRRDLPALELAAGARLFLPLCGKTRDIGWLLAQGHEVVGAELSRLAIEQLFAELDVTPRITQAGALERFEAERLTIFAGNIFDLDHPTLGGIDAVYDRAALVALPEPVRARYAAHLVHMTHTAPQLLITFEYDQSMMAGPPFSVDGTEIRRHYNAAYHVDELDRRDMTDGLRGVKPARECVWRLRPR